MQQTLQLVENITNTQFEICGYLGLRLLRQPLPSSRKSFGIKDKEFFKSSLKTNNGIDNKIDIA
jgi:hypothetical protein